MTRLAFAFALLVSFGVNAFGQASSTNSGPANDPHPKACDGNNFPTSIGGSKECCQLGSELFHVGPNGELVHRQVGRACSLSGGSTNCGVASLPHKECVYGPCGARKVNIQPGTNTVIFHPKSNSFVCGYSTANAPDNAIFYPEPYDNTQPHYAGVTASCPYTTCLVGGRGASTYTVISAKGSATGHLKSEPPGIKLSGVHKATGSIERTITLIAEPTGRHARAVFSGDCIKTGEYGKKAECSMKLAPHPKVSVTYECEVGFTCARSTM